MKKNILSIALVAASMFGFSAMAQTPQDCKACQAGDKQECVKNNKCDKPCGPNLFEGMNLTADQQAKLKALAEKRQEACRSAREASKADRKANRDQRRAKCQADRKAWLEEVKGIVGPDQYVVFLENIVLNQPGRDGAPRIDRNSRPAKGPKAGKAHHHGHDGHRAPKTADRQAK